MTRRFQKVTTAATRRPRARRSHTRNFLLRLNGDLCDPIVERNSAARGHAAARDGRSFRGSRMLRPFAWRGALWCVACVRDLSPEGWCEQVLARIDDTAPGLARLADWRVLRPDGPRRHEKNWMPRVAGDVLQFIYLCDPTRIVDDQARTVAETAPPIAGRPVPGRLATDRIRRRLAGARPRCARAGQAAALSAPLRLVRRRVEAARREPAASFLQTARRRVRRRPCLAPRRQRLMISYGVDDSQSWIATVDANDVRRVLEDAERLPSGAVGTEPQVGRARRCSAPTRESAPL